MWPFDQNYQQMYQRYASAWDQGTYGQLPEQEVQQQNPDLLHQIMGPGGPLGSTGAKMAVAGIAALAAKKLLGGGRGAA